MRRQDAWAQIDTTAKTGPAGNAYWYPADRPSGLIVRRRRAVTNQLTAFLL
jgi:hypothetical protein